MTDKRIDTLIQLIKELRLVIALGKPPSNGQKRQIVKDLKKLSWDKQDSEFLLEILKSLV